MPNVKRYIMQFSSCAAIAITIVGQSLAFASPLELSVEQSISLALKNNPAVLIAMKDKEKSAWSVDESEAGKLPSLSFGSNYSQSGSTGDFSNSNDSFSNNLRLNWPVYTGGRVESQIKQAELGVTTADLGLEKTKQQIKLDASLDYYSVLQTRNLVSVNQQTVDNLTQHLKNVQAKYDAGVVAKSDVLRAEVELANAQQNLIKAQNNHELAITKLLTTMNLDAGTEINLTGELKYEPADQTLDDYIKMAKSNRPDIAQAQAAVNVSEESVNIAKSGNLPSVSLSASTGWNDSILPEDGTWSVGLSASWNLFDAGVTKAKVKQAEANLDKAHLQTEQVNDSVEQEVRQAYLNMKEAEKRLDTTSTAVSKAEEDLYIAGQKYDAGVGTNLDVIDAQLALTQAKTNYVQALYDYNTNQAKIEKAVGAKVES